MKKSDILIAKEQLEQNDIVIAMVKDGKLLFSSKKKGIQPFFDALEQRKKEEYIGCSIADRVIGKAALMLAAYIGAKEVYTPLASQHALDAALKLDLDLETDKVVPFIINRTQDGMCPMEKTVLDIFDPKKAYEALENKLQKLKLG